MASKPRSGSAASRTSRTQKNARANRQRDWAEDFLSAFKSLGLVTAACEQLGVGRRTVYDRRENDAEFREAWETIEHDVVERMEHEAHRRAVEGCERAIFHQGTVVGYERVYSDTLLMFLMKARKPAIYRENVRHELTGDGGGPVVIDVLAGEDPASVSPQARREIAKALEKEKKRGGDDRPA